MILITGNFNLQISLNINSVCNCINHTPYCSLFARYQKCPCQPPQPDCHLDPDWSHRLMIQDLYMTWPGHQTGSCLWLLMGAWCCITHEVMRSPSRMKCRMFQMFQCVHWNIRNALRNIDNVAWNINNALRNIGNALRNIEDRTKYSQRALWAWLIYSGRAYRIPN